MRARSALLVIDVQESFRQRPADWADMVDPEGALGRIEQLVAAARAAHDLIVWITHSEPGTGTVFDPALGHVRVMSRFEIAEEEPEFVKTSVNAFTSTGLQQLLVQQGVQQLVVCGIRTEQCCETTARVASDLGFAVTFVLDATTTSGVAAGEFNPALDGITLMQGTAGVLADRGFAEVITTHAQLARGTHPDNWSHR